MYVREPYVEKSIGLWSYIHSKYALFMMEKSFFFFKIYKQAQSFNSTHILHFSGIYVFSYKWLSGLPWNCNAFPLEYHYGCLVEK